MAKMTTKGYKISRIWVWMCEWTWTRWREVSLLSITLSPSGQPWCAGVFFCLLPVVSAEFGAFDLACVLSVLCLWCWLYCRCVWSPYCFWHLISLLHLGCLLPAWRWRYKRSLKRIQGWKVWVDNGHKSVGDGLFTVRSVGGGVGRAYATRVKICRCREEKNGAERATEGNLHKSCEKTCKFCLAEPFWRGKLKYLIAKIAFLMPNYR